MQFSSIYRNITNSLDSPCKRTLHSTHFNLNTEHTMDNLNHIYPLLDNPGIVTEVRARADGHTDK